MTRVDADAETLTTFRERIRRAREVQTQSREDVEGRSSCRVSQSRHRADITSESRLLDISEAGDTTSDIYRQQGSCPDNDVPGGSMEERGIHGARRGQSGGDEYGSDSQWERCWFPQEARVKPKGLLAWAT